MLKLSIIIPVYNVEKYLRKCLDSVIDTSLDGYEIIAVNDGSTDGSPSILSEYAARYPSLLHVITTENGGLGHARNTGLALARGEYVQFLDSDDTLCPHALPEILETLRRDFDLCFFDLVGVDENGRQLSYNIGSERPGPFSLAENPGQLLCIPHACNKIYRRSLFTETGILFPDRLWFEDLATIPRLYLHARKMIYTPKPWYVYLQRSGSIMNTKNPQRNLEMITAVDTTLNYYREKGIFDRYRDELCYMTVYHQLITSGVRVNLIDPDSKIQDELLEDFLRKFPDYRENPYLKKQSRKYKLLTYLITRRHRKALHLLMSANNRVKQKKV